MLISNLSSLAYFRQIQGLLGKFQWKLSTNVIKNQANKLFYLTKPPIYGKNKASPYNKTINKDRLPKEVVMRKIGMMWVFLLCLMAAPLSISAQENPVDITTGTSTYHAGDVEQTVVFQQEDDIDEDGAPNAEDNCPTLPNPNQEDEDDDGLGDICDNCPQVSGILAEQDEVYDICDL